MPIPKVPQLPRDAVVDATGRLTPQFHRWLDSLFQKVGGSGAIPSESISPKAIVNVSNDAKVDWVDVNASAGLIRVYGPGGVGTGWSRYEGTSEGYTTLGPFPATTFSKAYNFIYYVAYDPSTGVYTCTTDFRETLKDGLYQVGVARANASFGGAGATSGGGGSATGGVGGGQEDPTIGIKPGFGYLG